MDPIDDCIRRCAAIAKENGVVMFAIAIGDESSYQTFKFKETWAKYKRRIRQERRDRVAAGTASDEDLAQIRWEDDNTRK